MPLISTFGGASARGVGQFLRRATTAVTAAAYFEARGGGATVPAGGQTASMTTAQSVFVAYNYSRPGEPANHVKFYVTKSGGALTEWSFAQVSPSSDGFGTGAEFSSSSTGYAGAGTYTFYFAVRRDSTGAFDLTSNEIVLTVTA